MIIWLSLVPTQHCHVMRPRSPITQLEGQQVTICEVVSLPVRQNWFYGSSMQKKNLFLKNKIC